MKDKLRIETLPIEQIDLIKPLWENLRNYLQERSTHFTNHMKRLSFEKRKAGLLQKDALHLLLAKNDSTPVGYCISAIEDSEGMIESLFVSSDFRKCRIGEMLIGDSLKWLEGHGVQSVSLNVSEGNEQVMDFYRKWGFEVKIYKLTKVNPQ